MMLVQLTPPPLMSFANYLRHAFSYAVVSRQLLILETEPITRDEGRLKSLVEALAHSTVYIAPALQSV